MYIRECQIDNIGPKNSPKWPQSFNLTEIMRNIYLIFTANCNCHFKFTKTEAALEYGIVDLRPPNVYTPKEANVKGNSFKLKHFRTP